MIIQGFDLLTVSQTVVFLRKAFQPDEVNPAMYTRFALYSFAFSASKYIVAHAPSNLHPLRITHISFLHPSYTPSHTSKRLMTKAHRIRTVEARITYHRQVKRIPHKSYSVKRSTSLHLPQSQCPYACETKDSLRTFTQFSVAV